MKEYDKIPTDAKWGTLKNSSGGKLYEGFLRKGKPCGAGTVYYSNGLVYMTGVFGIKGLLCGREYFPDGTLRYEGVYRLNDGYGPNYPISGVFFNSKGEKIFEGRPVFKRSGLGWPIVLEPENFGPVNQPDRPKFPWLMWNDVG